MARVQTLFSELAVAVAINGGEITTIANLDDYDIELYQNEYARRWASPTGRRSVDSLYQAGAMIRESYKKQGIDNFKVEWTGKDSMKAMSTVAKDIFISTLNMRISVKENADVFINGSPEKIFSYMPFGRFGQYSRGSDWFIQTAALELDHYFLVCGGETLTGYSSVEQFYKLAERGSKKQFSLHVASLHSSKKEDVLNAYSILCRRVSDESATIFNKNLESYLISCKNRSVALSPLFYYFFRINGVKYILAGTDRKKPFAVEVMNG